MTSNTSTGYIIINARAGGGTLPLPDVKIGIYKDSELISTLLTDRSGVAGPAAIPTPPLSDSFIPGGSKPYSQINIVAEKPGYYTMQYIGAAIYPGITSIQQINMIPLPDSPTEAIPKDDTIRYYEGQVPNL